MHRFRLAATRVCAALACAALASACYRVTVNTGTTPTATVIDKQWVNSFVYGLVPPSAPISVAQQCGGNVASVVTQHSFLNGLVSAITWGIYSPIQVTVTCGGARRTSMGLPNELLGAPANVKATVADTATR